MNMTNEQALEMFGTSLENLAELERRAKIYGFEMTSMGIQSDIQEMISRDNSEETMEKVRKLLNKSKYLLSIAMDKRQEMIEELYSLKQEKAERDAA